MRVIVALPFAALVLLSPAAAQTIYRYDRGDILPPRRSISKSNSRACKRPASWSRRSAWVTANKIEVPSLLSLERERSGRGSFVENM